MTDVSVCWRMKLWSLRVSHKSFYCRKILLMVVNVSLAVVFTLQLSSYLNWKCHDVHRQFFNGRNYYLWLRYSHRRNYRPHEPVSWMADGWMCTTTLFHKNIWVGEHRVSFRIGWWGTATAYRGRVLFAKNELYVAVAKQLGCLFCLNHVLKSLWWLIVYECLWCLVGSSQGSISDFGTDAVGLLCVITCHLDVKNSQPS